MYLDSVNTYTTVSSTLLSLGVAIFTLSTAFIVSKRNLLSEYQKQVEKDGISLTMMRKIDATKDFLKTMRNITKNSIIIIATATIVFTLCIYFNYINIGCWIHVLVIPTTISAVSTFYCIRKLFLWYRKQ